MATTVGSSTSLFEDAESKPKLNVLVSPDDVAWADSCLTNDPDLSEPNLDSLKEALLEFVTFNSEPLETSKSKRRGSRSPSTEETDTFMNFEVDVDNVPFTEATENIDEDHPLKENIDEPVSISYLANPFLPTYKDEMREIQYFSDTDVDLGFSEFAMESISEDIFKVWDLGVPVEEDSLIKQLKNALADSSLKKVPSTFDDSQASNALADSSLKKVPSTFDDSQSSKGFEDDLIDDLVAGIADMSLQRRSG